MIPGTHDSVLSFDDRGIPIPRVEQDYLRADRLNPLASAGGSGRSRTAATR
jgi:hypothetical protein